MASPGLVVDAQPYITDDQTVPMNSSTSQNSALESSNTVEDGNASELDSSKDDQ